MAPSVLALFVVIPVVALAQVAQVPAGNLPPVALEPAQVGGLAFVARNALVRAEPNGPASTLFDLHTEIPVVVRRVEGDWVTVNPVHIAAEDRCFQSRAPWDGFDLNVVVAQAGLVPVLAQPMTLRSADSAVTFHAGARVDVEQRLVDVPDASGPLASHAHAGRSYPAPRLESVGRGTAPMPSEELAGALPAGVVIRTWSWLVPGVRTRPRRARFKTRCLTIEGASRAWRGPRRLGDRRAPRRPLVRPRGLYIVEGSPLTWPSGAPAGRTTRWAMVIGAVGSLKVAPNGNYCGGLRYTDPPLMVCAEPSAWRGFESGSVLHSEPASVEPRAPATPTVARPRPTPAVH
ncbi:MAG: hypothetical protein KC668_08175 [Myxococcales bacterium]|nr:hypothetical protein [Myxococcales bacterium]